MNKSYLITVTGKGFYTKNITSTEKFVVKSIIDLHKFFKDMSFDSNIENLYDEPDINSSEYEADIKFYTVEEIEILEF